MGEAFVSCFGHSTFFQHVVAHVDEDLKLLFTGQFVGIIAFFDDVEHHFLGSNHRWSSDRLVKLWKVAIVNRLNAPTCCIRDLFY